MSPAVTVDSHKSCNIANVPSHAVMAKKGSSVDIFKKVLLKASELCQGILSATNCSGFTIFESAGGKKDLLFKDSTKKLVDVGDKSVYDRRLADYFKSVDGLNTCKDPGSPAVMLSPGFSLVLLVIGALVMRLI